MSYCFVYESAFRQNPQYTTMYSSSHFASVLCRVYDTSTVQLLYQYLSTQAFSGTSRSSVWARDRPSL